MPPLISAVAQLHLRPAGEATRQSLPEAPRARPPEVERDILILRSLQEALERLAGDEFRAAFNNSTNLEDYRWGKLHRIVFTHTLGDPFNIPPAGGFAHLAPALRGVAVDGGFEVVDASGHDARAERLDAFMFDSGPARRFLGEARPEGVRGLQVIPGGQSGVLGSPLYASQLGLWLTNDYHPLWFTPEEVELRIRRAEVEDEVKMLSELVAEADTLLKRGEISADMYVSWLVSLGMREDRAVLRARKILATVKKS